MPLPKVLKGEGMPENVRILDRKNRLLYSVQGLGLHIETPFINIPRPLVDALISTEDRTFYHHHGISLRGITRAAIHDIRAGRIKEGGSTITQQLVRTLLQPKKRGFLYKIREGWLAIQYDARFTKNEILERYLNESFFGQGAYGVTAAAKVYFNADVSALSLGQSALLIGLLNAPSALNPFKDLGAAKLRRDLVLRAMFTQSTISQEEFESALAEPIQLTNGKVKILAPHFVLWLLEKYPEFRSGNDVITTIDLDLQTATQDIITRQIEKLKEKNVTSAAVVVLDAHTGEILTMVGSSDYFDSERDGAVNVALSPRQPGSALKPFTYALALSQGMTAATTIADIETQFFTAEGNPYIPRNYDYGYHGLVRLREALANSYNISAVKLLEKVGVDRLLDFLQLAGLQTLIESPEHYGLALTLGDGEVRLLDLAAAYGIFVNKGYTLHPISFHDQIKVPGKLILDPKISWLISDILSDKDARTAEFGRDGPLNFSYPVAAKTGTTRNSRDNWTVGFTTDRIVAVWVGNADNAPMRGTSGVTGAGPIFHDVMEEAMKNIEKKEFQKPEGIRDVEICRLSGKLPTPLCTDTLIEHFVDGTAPHKSDDMFRALLIDTRNGLLATELCKKEFVQKETFTQFPSDMRKWARENGWKLPPEKYSSLCPSSAIDNIESELQKSITITRPAPEATFLLDSLIPDHRELIIFEARSDVGMPTLSWFVNGTRVGEGSSPDYRFAWKPQVGSFVVQAGSGAHASTIRITITK